MSVTCLFWVHFLVYRVTHIKLLQITFFPNLFPKICKFQELMGGGCGSPELIYLEDTELTDTMVQNRKIGDKRREGGREAKKE